MSYTLTLIPVIAVPAFWPQWNVCDVVNFHKCVLRRRQTAFGGEKWVPCVERWTSAPVLWPVKGICLKVWGDMDVPECGWGESCCERAGTYFKTWLFVLVKAYGDSSTTGDLSCTQPSRLETGELSSHSPSLVALGPLGLVSCTGCPVNTGLTGAMLFYFNSLFSYVLLSLSLCLNVCVFFSLSLYPPKNRRSAAWLPGKRRAMPPSLSLPLCQLYLNKYGLSWVLILNTAASILKQSKSRMFRQQGPPKVPIQLPPQHLPPFTHTYIP